MLKNRIYYAALILVTFWFMLMYDGVFVEGMFVATIFLPVALIIINYITKYRLKSNWMAKSIEIMAGQEIDISSILYNSTIFPINRVEINFQVKDLTGNKEKYTMVTNLMPGVKRKCTMQLKPNFAGVIEVQLTSIKIFDWMGLTSTKKKKGSTLKIIVYPKQTGNMPVIMQAGVISAEDGEKYSDIVPGNDRSEIFTIDKYREGDNIRDIHWKLSLKTDEFMVKTYSMPICNEVNVFVDSTIVNASAGNIDSFFSCIFAFLNEVESSGAKVNIYGFDENAGVCNADRRSIIADSFNEALDIREICTLFMNSEIKGRNVLFSSRLNDDVVAETEGLAAFYTNIDAKNVEMESVVIEEINVLGITADEKTDGKENKYVELGNEMYINSDNNDVGVYTSLLRSLLVVLGVYSSLAIFLDVVAVLDSSVNLAISTAVSVIAMYLSTLIKKKRYKFICIIALITGMALFLGVGNIISGSEAVVEAINVYVESGMGAVQTDLPGFNGERGILTAYEDEMGRFIAFAGTIISVLLFSCTWKKVSLPVHFALTLPMVLFCFVCGHVPEGLYICIYMAYFFGIIVYRVTYSNIIKNEKYALKKAFYESTLNIGAIAGYIVMIIVAIIMLADYLKGYNRSEKLREMKQQINEFMENFDINELLKEDEAMGGMDNGKLGRVDKVVYSGDKMLTVKVEGNIKFPLYVKGYVGTEYTGSKWEIIYDHNNSEIKKKLLEGEITLTDAYNIPYYLLGLEKMGGTQLTAEPVRQAVVTIVASDTDDNICYIPYGARYDFIDLEKDGVMPEINPGNLGYEIYQIMSVDNITTNKSEEPYIKKEILYSEAIRGIYSAGSYSDGVDMAIQKILPKEYEYKGKKVRLSSGTDETGMRYTLNV